ncbi:hypothetical protein [Clostridium cellulovorans]|uniref:Uncharacterized protein n=1 Tax=Clostridium cellulovorans (strain ATCC 35296 / DSM 3052 / OCM 3 / 743B) TaxID=573061 RepID=D9SRF8_CLOC7|nr:hypothetical protein [Clostridium cellulovorans]ADL52387.1 hypothetical protein Clocel_2687 [Clostridium cellulovorans 743B]
MEIQKMFLFISSIVLAFCAFILNASQGNQTVQMVCSALIILSFAVIIVTFLRMKKKK